MSALDDALRDLVIANRIIAHEGVVDAYGHISVRHPDNPKRYLMSRSRSPELVDFADIMEFELDGTPVGGDTRPPYIERHIHGGIYEARPEVQAVLHSHALEVLPFSISLSTPLRAAIHSGGLLGHNLRIWDIADKFGDDTDLLVRNMAHGRDLAARLAGDRVVLMRAHGFAAAGRSLPETVRLGVYMPKNARALMDALRLGDVKYLSPGEIDIRLKTRTDAPEWYRAWEYWAARAGCTGLLDGPRRTSRKMAAKAGAKKKGAKKRRR